MAFNTDTLILGNLYTRRELAKIWGYNGIQGFSRGVFTPANSNTIVLFVTREKQKLAFQYNDFISLDRLHWEGEEKHLNDVRIANAHTAGKDIILFYRDIHHTPYRYYGSVRINSFIKNTSRPSEFIFELLHNLGPEDDIQQASKQFKSLSETERHTIIKARLGQGEFRENLLRYWKGCAITKVTKPELLRASHIKPWRISSNAERLNIFNGLLLLPHYDVLFDKGYITFDDKGSLEPSPAILNIPPTKLGIDLNVRLNGILSAHIPFLEYHREKMFVKHTD